MALSDSSTEFDVDAPVDRKKTALTHRYKVFYVQEEEETRYEFEYDLRPSVVESVIAGLKDLFTGGSPPEGEPSENIPDKYMPEIPDVVEEQIVDQLEDEVKQSRIPRGRKRQEVGECQIQLRLPRTYAVRLTIGKEYRAT